MINMRKSISGLVLTGIVVSGLAATRYNATQHKAPGHIRAARAAVARNSVAQKIVNGARAQIGTIYDPAYFTMRYPNGDVPRDRGACTDVIVRALRRAGYDLQRLMHEDMKRNFSLYPRKWGLRRTDKNIDHRRVPNQMVFFKRHGTTLTREVSAHTLKSWQPGDIVCWKFDNGLDHTGIISDRRNSQGLPLVIHNLAVCVEEDVLLAWKITGHFRYPKRLQSL